MGKIRFSFALMLLAAFTVLLAGERLARREIEVRSVADREKVQEFSLLLSAEFERMGEAFLENIQRFGNRARLGDDQLAVIDRRDELRAIYIFEQDGKARSQIPIPRVGVMSTPEVLIKGHRRPLIPETAITFPADFFETISTNDHGWKASADQIHRAYWFSPESGVMVALLFDGQVLDQLFETNFLNWGEGRFQTLTARGEKIALQHQNGRAILGRPEPQEAPMAIPFQNDYGIFWLRAWDEVTFKTEYHQATLLGTGLLASVLAGLGWFLFLSQKRAYEEAEQRVSFTNRVSHELGTPLTNMTLNLELAERTLLTAPEKSGERLAKVREEVLRLSRLIGNVLTRSRQEQGKLRESLSEIIPDEVIGSIVEQFRPALARREIEISWQGNAAQSMTLDSDALTQIVWNLISNVEKHAAQGHWIGIISAFKDDRLIVEVTDRGGGIERENHERIFESFERVHDSINEGASGAGLGLSICRDLTELLKGKLILIPQNDGTTFRLTLPNRS